jgi:hypothetical protein
MNGAGRLYLCKIGVKPGINSGRREASAYDKASGLMTWARGKGKGRTAVKMHLLARKPGRRGMRRFGLHVPSRGEVFSIVWNLAREEAA